MRFNRQAFFDGYRGIAGSLSQSQVEGIEFLLDKIEEDSEWENIAQIAYVLSTTEHETARTFRPIKEYRSKPGSKGRARQDKYWMTGYMGRGFVQLTHRENYEHYGIADDPSQAMEPEKAYEILSDGMRNGVFTGKKLGDYVNRGRKDYFNARKVVNGLDKAQQIADRARAFESILLESAELAESSEAEVEEPTRHHASKPVVHASPDKPAEDNPTAPTGDKADGTPVKAGEPAPDTPAQQGEAIVGGRPQDPPKNVTKPWSARIPAIIGGGGGIVTAVKGFIDGNNLLAGLGIICLTILGLALIFRSVLNDWLRLKLNASPDKYNVK